MIVRFGISAYFVYYNWSLVKIMFRALSLVPVLKQRFTEYTEEKNGYTEKKMEINT